MKDISLSGDEFLPLRDVVFNTLRNAILTGELEPGERLMEIKLAEKLGVSRTPIREAIRKLELEGLVVMTPRKSAEVARITRKDLTDVLEVRRVLECLAIELSCQKITGDIISQLEENLVRFKGAIRKNDIKEIAITDVDFHEIIYKSTGNKRLIQILNNLREQMYRYRFEYIKDKETRENLANEHRSIIDALAVGNIEEGRRAILKHIDKQEITILENIK
ncbi:MAG: GntR family transcriptional regulator [Lachnospiraceae bacterium]